MIKESGPAFDAAHVHRQLMEKKRLKQSSTISNEESQLRASMGSQKNNSELQNLTRRENTHNSLTKVSPVFGGAKTKKRKSSSVRKSTDRKQGMNTTLQS